MSTLDQKLDIYPMDLLTDCPPQDGSSGRVWWVVYTRARQENAVARELFQFKIPFYLPQIARTVSPLFRGYLFVFAADDELLMTLEANRISRVLPVANQDRLRRDLVQVSRLIAADAPFRVEKRLKTGQVARIKSGPLRGFEGTIFSRNGSRRLFVTVDVLQQGISIEIEDVVLEAI